MTMKVKLKLYLLNTCQFQLSFTPSERLSVDQSKLLMEIKGSSINWKDMAAVFTAYLM